jgi:hypothetical protein
VGAIVSVVNLVDKCNSKCEVTGGCNSKCLLGVIGGCNSKCG